MKNKFVLAAGLAFGLGLVANAHELWVVSSNNDKLNVDLIYGHDFAVPEVIAKKRVELFETPYVLGSDGKVKLQQVGENYHFEGKKLNDNTHLVVASYKPTYWTQKSDGKWEMHKTKKDYPDAIWCGLSSFNAKSIVLGKDDGSFATTMIGKGLEITPVTLPSKFKANETAIFKLTRDGEPVADASVTGAFAGFIDDHGHDKEDGHGGENDEMRAFYNKTSSNGEFAFKPLKSGLWYLMVEIDRKVDDPRCENDWTQASITFNVK